MFCRMIQTLVLLLSCAALAGTAPACAGAETLPDNGGEEPVEPGEPDEPDEPDEPAGPVCATYEPARRVSTLASEMVELSGLVVSRRYCDIIWAHNDSGHSADIYALRISTGELVSTVRLENVSAYDWEDIAIARCDDDWCLYVGDIGDNLARRDEIQIHRVVEPDPFAGAEQFVQAETMQGHYDDGPRDAEALVAVGDDLYILSKTVGTSHLYHAPFEARSDVVFERLAIVVWGDVTARGRNLMVTGADYLGSPPRLIIRGYLAMIEFIGEEGDDIPTLLQGRAKAVPAGLELQSEAVGYGARGYYHAGEGNNVPLWFIACDDDEPGSERRKEWECVE